MSRRIDNLSALDWDDSALIKAYNRGMSLRVKDFEEEDNTAMENFMKHSKNKLEWKVGDHCRALYHGDGMWYEAKIISIDGDMCTVFFLGYDEEAEVELDSLDKSLGKKTIKKQKKNAKKNVIMIDVDGSASEDDTRNDHNVTRSSHHHQHRRHHHHHHHSKRGYLRNNETHMFDQSNNYTAAESTFYSAYPVARYSEMPTAVPPPPPPPPVPMPSCSEVTQDPSVTSMLTAWYMAGYYTGMHEAQKNASQQHYYRH